MYYLKPGYAGATVRPRLPLWELRMSWSDKEFGFETRAIHAGQQPDPTTGAVVTPLYLTSTYVHSEPGVFAGYDYSRAGNPTRAAYESCVANLEGARFGFAFASGCLGTTTAMHLLKQGDHVVACDDMYGGTYRLFEDVFRKQGLDFTYVDLADPEALSAALRPETRLIWIETPTNPLMKLIDIAAVADIAHQHISDRLYAAMGVGRKANDGTFDGIVESEVIEE